MLSKSQVKFIQQLSQKKYRVHHGLFVVEGHKSIEEFIHAGYSPKDLYVTDHHLFRGYDALCIASQQMKSISHLKTPSNALAVFPTPSHTVLKETDLILTLDAIQDPGNMGTLIRLCDWFGVTYLVCSHDTVDCYNPKVVRSSMGSLARVEVHYVDLVADTLGLKNVSAQHMRAEQLTTQAWSITPKAFARSRVLCLRLNP